LPFFFPSVVSEGVKCPGLAWVDPLEKLIWGRPPTPCLLKALAPRYGDKKQDFCSVKVISEPFGRLPLMEGAPNRFSPNFPAPIAMHSAGYSVRFFGAGRYVVTSWEAAGVFIGSRSASGQGARFRAIGQLNWPWALASRFSALWQRWALADCIWKF